MKMSDLYHEMKEALTYFGLKFSSMDQVEVTFTSEHVKFTFEDRALLISRK